MKIRRIKNFVGSKLGEITSYLRVDLNKFLGEVCVTLGHLTFADNFQSFSTDVTLLAGATVPISHNLGTADLDWIITRIKGDTRIVEALGWTASTAFLTNLTATDITARIFFFRRR